MISKRHSTVQNLISPIDPVRLTHRTYEKTDSKKGTDSPSKGSLPLKSNLEEGRSSFLKFSDSSHQVEVNKVYSSLLKNELRPPSRIASLPSQSNEEESSVNHLPAEEESEQESCPS
mmetsp:Transcript_41677/g.63683  ORF Transcript_41677/g.63683 Transcript_41677/m.63683 type:complete len:117 (-) Transcript_41677:469-819(-)